MGRRTRPSAARPARAREARVAEHAALGQEVKLKSRPGSFGRQHVKQLAAHGLDGCASRQLPPPTGHAGRVVQHRELTDAVVRRV